MGAKVKIYTLGLFEIIFFLDKIRFVWIARWYKIKWSQSEIYHFSSRELHSIKVKWNSRSKVKLHKLFHVPTISYVAYLWTVYLGRGRLSLKSQGSVHYHVFA